MNNPSDQKYPALNLPPAALRFGCADGQPTVFDPLRRRFVRLTPEEWVRQHFTAYLTSHLGYPSGLLANEVSLSLNGTARRCDSVLYGRDGRPRMIVEYKAPHVALTQKVFDQICRYNIVLRVRWLVVSNGRQTVCCRVDLDSGPYAFVPQLPSPAEVEEGR